MKKILLLLTLLCAVQIVDAQDWPELSRLQKQLEASSPDTGRIGILLKMAEFEVFKPGEYKADLDSAANYIKQAEVLNRELKSPEAAGYITIEKSYLAKDRGDMKAGKALIENAISQLSQTGNKYLLGKAYFGLADYYDVVSATGLKTKIDLVQKAADIYHSGGFTEREAFCYKNLADLIDDLDAGFKMVERAFKLYQSINYKKMQGVYDMYAQYYILKSNYQPALKFGLTALKTAEEQNDVSSNTVAIQNHIAIIYERLNDFKNAIQYFNKAIETAKKIGDRPASITLIISVSNLYLLDKQTAKAKKTLQQLSQDEIENSGLFNKIYCYRILLSCYTELKEFENARRISVIFAPLILKCGNDPRVQLDSYNVLISYFLASKQNSQANNALAEADRILKGIPSVFYQEIYAGLRMRLDTATHDYKRAVYHAILRKKFSDSVYAVNKSKAIQELQVQFHVREKEKQVSFFKQKAALESQNLQQANIVKDYTFAGIVLTLIIAGLLYRQNFLKQKSTRIISDKNTLLQHLLAEKEWLLKEVHHRVKNNLHTVICLLESQAAYLENDALKAIENSQHRIYAMSLIHQKLYQSDDVKTIDMDVYLKEFIRYLDDSFGNPSNIKMQFDIEPIKLGVAQAIPIGLIINETVTNSFKYAFPNNRRGIIKIALRQSDNLIELIISDDGIGMVLIDSFEDAGSLGMELIKGLSRDLRGDFKLDVKNGTCIRVLFEINLLDKAVLGSELSILA